MRNMKENKKAFTLAEVIITLIVIGVVSAVTIPGVIQSTKKQEYVSALKKAHSTLSQAARQIIAEEGNVPNWGLTADKAGRDKIYEMFKKHLMITKDCNDSTNMDCFAKGYYKQLNKSYVSDWGNFNTLNSNHHKMVLSDGMSLLFDDDLSPNCSYSWLNEENICIIFFIDINGAKKTNTFGRDTFQFVLKENGIYPAGCGISGKNCTKDGSGFHCACKVLREGDMNY